MKQTSQTVASLDGITKNYGKLRALDGVDLDIRGGQLLSLLGPNGAGKSTAIALLLGLTRPDQGKVRLFGESPQQLAARRRIGVMLQSAQLPDTLRVGELLRLTASYYPDPRALEESAEIAGVRDLVSRPCGKLSGGQHRRVQFALALCGRPELLFLDEPTVGMDIEARQRLWQAMRDLVAEGCSVVLTTHYLEEAEALSQRVVVLGRGRVLSKGSVDELRARVAMSSVRCRTRLDRAVVAAWPEVREVRGDGEHLLLISSHCEQLVRRLLDADGGLADLEVRRAGLAEAFADITRDDHDLKEAA